MENHSAQNNAQPAGGLRTEEAKAEQSRILALKTYRALSSIPALSDASFASAKANGDRLGGGLLRMKIKSKDYEKEDSCVKRISINLPKNLFTDASVTAAFQSDMDAQFHGSFTPARLDPIVAEKSAQGRLETVYLKEEPHPKKPGQVRRSVEVWAEQVRVFYQDVTDLHGPFVTDAVYGSLDIHARGSRLLYSAEAKAEEGTAENKSKSFEYTPSLGEKSGNTLRPTLFTCSYRAPIVEDRAIISLPQLVHGLNVESTSGERLAQARISEDGGRVFTATAYAEQGNGGVLGVIYCANRPSRIRVFPLARDDQFGEEARQMQRKIDVVTSPEERLAFRSCQIVHHRSMSTTIMLSSPEGGAHANASYLHMFSDELKSGPGAKVTLKVVHRALDRQRCIWRKTTRSVVTDIFPTSMVNGPMMCTDPARPNHGSFFLMNGIKDFQAGCYVISLATTRDQVNACFLQGIEVVATDGKNKMLYKAADAITPESILLGTFDLQKLVSAEDQHDDGDVFYDKSDVVTLFDGQEHLDASLGRILHPGTGLPAPNKLEAYADLIEVKEACRGSSTLPQVVIKKGYAEGESQPVILMPHGGPHSCLTNWWWPSTATLALMGFRIIIPNYVGSIGGTKEYVEALVGHCGTKDVQDCIRAIELLSEQGVLDRNQLYVSGGSHGGFLTAHLIGKQPSMFRAAQLRNPVIDIATMVATTDIPDWSYAEVGLPYDVRDPPAFPSMEALAKMREASPIRHVADVQARVVIMLGLSDRRVPPSQGLQYYHALKGLGKDVEMLTFKDADHALETIDASTWTMDKTFSFFDKTAREARVPWSFFRELEE